MLTVALVNNMPDSAFLDTEEQFRAATAAGAGGEPIELELYTFTELAREEPVAGHIRERYRNLGELWMNAPDALIVTGTEPVQTQLPYEAYWPYLARLVEWASASVPTVLLSCLAAHATVLLFDGIERIPRREKCSGVFRAAVTLEDSGLTDGLPTHVHVPHSRVNSVFAEAMDAAGYRIVIGEGDGAVDGVGWSIAARRCGDSEFLLCQGHPEYSTTSLLREYRRDVRRSLFGRGTVPFPEAPDGYLGPAGRHALEAYRAQATAPGADPREQFARFPFEQLAEGIENTWRPWASTLYGNWLTQARVLTGRGT